MGTTRARWCWFAVWCQVWWSQAVDALVHHDSSFEPLNLILCRTGSQCNSHRTGIMLSRLLAPVTNRAAAFCITCIFLQQLTTYTSEHTVTAIKSTADKILNECEHRLRAYSTWGSSGQSDIPRRLLSAVDYVLVDKGRLSIKLQLLFGVPQVSK